MLVALPTIAASCGNKLISLSRSAKVAIMLAVDLISLPVCFAIAVMLRMGSLEQALLSGVAPFIAMGLITIPVFASVGLYGAVIRFIDHRLFVSAAAGLAAVVAFVYLASSLFDYKGLPHSAVLNYWFIAFPYVVASRIVARAVVRGGKRGNLQETECVAAIYGAGEAGAKLAMAMRISGKYRAVCFFDDNRYLVNRNVAGLKVLHPDRLVATVDQRRIELIVIAIPSATVEERKEIMRRARKTNAAVKILSSLMELGNEEITVRSIRDVKIDDLLGREPIRPRADLFKKCVREKNILVTGAGGSIGSELCRQIVTLGPCRLHLLDHSEYALYKIEQETARRYPTIPIQAHLGSVCDARLMERIIDECKIDTIYHAAAYKHVPLVEANIAEGVRNNILGAHVVVGAAFKFNVKTCVLVSTDKAVRPTSIMGASKRVAELVFQAAAIRAKADSVFCMVRFGNVLGSSGSVVPLFKNQIESGGPITITHPEVVRYFMSIPEAAQLIVQAGSMATGGDVFVMDMGKPVKIVDLARAMLATCGLKEKGPTNPNGDIEIEFVGLRPGEKLYEELFAGDNARPSKHPRILTTSEYAIDPDVLDKQITYLMAACANNDIAMITSLLRKLVKGYMPNVQSRVMEPRHVFQNQYAPSLQYKGFQKNEQVGRRVSAGMKRVSTWKAHTT